MSLPEQFVALETRAYRQYWLGSVASVGGLQLLTIAQGWLVYELTQSAMDLGWLGAASAVPNVLMGLFGGALADRLDKRVVLRATALMNATVIFVLAALDFTGVVTVGHVLVLAALQSLVSGLDWPARSAVYPLLIDRAHMMSAVALNSIVWQSTRMIMPAIGGALLAITDTWVLFTLAGCGMVYMAWVVHRLDVHAPGTHTGSAVQHTLDGLRFIRDNRLFLLLMTIAFVAMFFGTSYISLMPAFAKLLGADSEGYGVLLSASGVGSLLGTFIAGAVQRSRNSGTAMLMCAGGFAPCIMLFALVANFADVIPGAYVFGLACVLTAAALSSVFNIVSMTIMQLRVPDALRGRVMGVHGVSFSFMSLGALFTGALATPLGTPFATICAASVVVLVVAWIALKEPELREQAHARA